MIKQWDLKKLTMRCLALLATVMLSTLTACVTEETTRDRPAGGGDIAQGGGSQGPASDERRFEVRLQLAVAYYQNGNTSQFAMQEVDKALELRPRSAEAVSLKGMIYDQMGDSANALTYLRSAAALEPNSGDYQSNYGIALCNNKQYSEGIGYLQKAASMSNNTNKVSSWVGMGVCYGQAGDIQRAEGSFHQALSIDPRNRVALYQLANYMFLRNDAQGAKNYLEQIGPIGNFNAQALWLGVKIARQQGDAYSMGQYAKRLRERYPNSTQTNALNRGDYNS